METNNKLRMKDEKNIIVFHNLFNRIRFSSGFKDNRIESQLPAVVVQRKCANENECVRTISTYSSKSKMVWHS